MRRLALLASLALLACSDPAGPPAVLLPPSTHTLIPGLQGPGELQDGNMPGPARGVFVPVMFESAAPISSIGFRTGFYAGNPEAPRAQVVITTMHDDLSRPARVTWASNMFSVAAESSAYVVPHVEWAPTPDTWYLIGVLVLCERCDALNYATLRIWSDPSTTAKPIPFESSGGDAAASAAIVTGEEKPTGYAVGNGWEGRVFGYSTRPVAVWVRRGR